MSVPFLFELRTLMDWIFTDTSMTFMDWLKMEDIFTNIYQLKCSRTLETEIPAPSGQKKKDMPKYIVGGTFLAAIIVAIWFPLALFAFSSAVGEPNIPHDFTMEIRIGPFDPIYYSGAQNNDIKP
jgi:piezo-type mechanosensitive ion channel component 1/2